MDGFELIAPGGWGSFQRLGVSLLGLMAMVLCVRETFNLIRGRHADFVGVLVRTGIAALMLVAVPRVAALLGGLALQINGSLEAESWNNLERGIRTGLSAARCDGVDWFDGLSLFFSARGWMMFFTYVVFEGFMLVKIAVLDVGWRVMFSLICLQAPLTLPLGLVDELGGLAHYWRNILGVAIWPVTFGLLMALTSAAFPETIERVANGEVSANCVAMPTEDGDTVQSNPDVGLVDWLKFLGMILSLLVLTWKVPDISAQVVGAGSAGALGVGALGTVLGGAGGVGATSTQQLQQRLRKRKQTQQSGTTAAEKAKEAGKAA